MNTSQIVDILWDCILFALKSFAIVYFIASMICGIVLFAIEGTLIGFILSCIILPDVIVSELIPFLVVIVILRLSGLWRESLRGSRRAWIYAISSYCLYFISVFIDFDSLYEIENTADDFVVSSIILLIWTPIFLLIPKRIFESKSNDDE